MVKTYAYNPIKYEDRVGCITIDPVRNRIWLGIETYGVTSNRQIVILNKDLSLIKIVEYFSNYKIPYPSIAFDESGYAYITSPDNQKYLFIEGALVKVSIDLRRIKEHYVVKGAQILYYGGYLYVAVSRYVDGYYRHIMVKLTKDPGIVEPLILSQERLNARFILVKISVIGDKLIVAGLFIK